MAADEEPDALGITVHDTPLFNQWLAGLTPEDREWAENNHVRMLHVRVAYRPTATILDIKNVLAARYTLPAASLRLIRDGTNLPDGTIVRDLAMHMEGSLALAVRR